MEILGLILMLVITAAFISEKLKLKEGGCLEKILIFLFIIVFVVIMLKIA